MGVSNSDYNDARDRIVAAAAVKCSIKEITSYEGKPTDDGRPVRDTDYVTLQFEEDVKTTDDEIIEAGGTTRIPFWEIKDPQDEKQEGQNFRNKRLWRQMVVCALKLDKNVKKAKEELEGAGGNSALIGRVVVANFKPFNDRDAVDKFEAVREE